MPDLLGPSVRDDAWDHGNGTRTRWGSAGDAVRDAIFDAVWNSVSSRLLVAGDLLRLKADVVAETRNCLANFRPGDV